VTCPDVVELCQALVRTPSPSAGEGPCADILERALRDAGLSPRRVGANVICERGTGERGLLLNSHLDTVPAAPGYTRDPYDGAVEDGRLYGLGAGDAKSCIAAMACAFCRADDPGPRGRLVLAATTEEETGGRGAGGSGASGLERIVDDLLPLEGAVVGEPTELAICTGQRGLVRLTLVAEGRAGHASRPWEGENAISKLARAVAARDALALELGEVARAPVLGPLTVQVTEITGGTAPNVIPARAQATVDMRTTPPMPNEEAIARVRDALTEIEVRVRSERYLPVRTGEGAQILRAARRALPDAPIRPFGGVSDLFFCDRAGVKGILLGPASGKQSHKADEFCAVAPLRQAVDAYTQIANQFYRD